MKLKFVQDENGKISLLVNEKPFDTEDYIDMVKHVKENKKIEIEELEENISKDEQKSIRTMVKEINSIKFSVDSDDISSDKDN